MATRQELRELVLRLLADPDGAQFEADLVNDGIVAALDAILPWHFKRSVTTLEGDGTLVAFQLPTDLYRILAVLDEASGNYIPKNILAAGRSPGDDLVSNQDWLEYPEGSITFANAPDDGITMTVYYGAVWDKPADDNTSLVVVEQVHQALAYYAASYTLLQSATASANVRQFNIDVDSGTPVMNPMRDMSGYFLERFRIYMDMMPSMERGVHG